MKYDSKKDTLKHITNVNKLLNIIINELIIRSINHDKSKLESPEKEIFDLYTPKLKNCKFNSDEYNKYKNEMKSALQHHYLNNEHHPEHFSNGILDTNLIDLCEMICDWIAASKRNKDGDIYKSIEELQKKYKYSDDLKKIFINTINILK